MPTSFLMSRTVKVSQITCTTGLVMGSKVKGTSGKTIYISWREGILILNIPVAFYAGYSKSRKEFNIGGKRIYRM